MPKNFLFSVLLTGALSMSCAGVQKPAPSTPPPPRPVPSQVVHARAQLPRELPEFGRVTPPEWLSWARAHGGLKKRGVPAVGEVALFGPRGGSVRWAGRVERVDADGTVLLQLRLQGQPVRLRMNLQHPTQRRHPSSHRVLNHYLEPGKTTAQLCLGWVSPPARPALVADAR